jgi:hypothetical protein
MENVLLWTGRVAVLAGVLTCAWAVYGRLTGNYYLGGFQVGTLLQAGTVALLVACVSFLLVLTNRPRR